MLDIDAFLAGRITYAEATSKYTREALYATTEAIFQAIHTIVDQATDADTVFVPKDAVLADAGEQGWTLAHVIVHFTASLEESAALASTLARGIAVEGRSRYETPWETVTTARQVQQRLRESQRICRAFLDAWPDTPNLDLTVLRIPRLGPMNAISLHLMGIMHAQMHLNQLRDIMQQAKVVTN